MWFNKGHWWSNRWYIYQQDTQTKIRKNKKIPSENFVNSGLSPEIACLVERNNTQISPSGGPSWRQGEARLSVDSSVWKPRTWHLHTRRATWGSSHFMSSLTPSNQQLLTRMCVLNCFSWDNILPSKTFVTIDSDSVMRGTCHSLSGNMSQWILLAGFAQNRH